jgi:nitrogen fixation-related uncharacterized protein
MSFLWVTIPATLLLSAVLLALALRAVLQGEFDEPEDAALRLHWDDDREPERSSPEPGPLEAMPRATGASLAAAPREARDAR